MIENVMHCHTVELLIQTRKRERTGGMFAVVRSEVMADQLTISDGGDERRLHLMVGGHPNRSARRPP